MRKPKDTTPKHADVGDAPRHEPEFPELTEASRFDRKMHEERSKQAGLSRAQAQKHAEADHRHWSPKQIEEHPHDD